MTDAAITTTYFMFVFATPATVMGAYWIFPSLRRRLYLARFLCFICYCIITISFGFATPKWFLKGALLSNENTVPSLPAPGDNITLNLKSIDSLNGYWRCSELTLSDTVAVFPGNKNGSWKPTSLEADDKPNWGGSLRATTHNGVVQDYYAYLKIKLSLPNDGALAGALLTGRLHMQVECPRISGKGTFSDQTVVYDSVISFRVGSDKDKAIAQKGSRFERYFYDTAVLFSVALAFFLHWFIFYRS